MANSVLHRYATAGMRFTARVERLSESARKVVAALPRTRPVRWAVRLVKGTRHTRLVEWAIELVAVTRHSWLVKRATKLVTPTSLLYLALMAIAIGALQLYRTGQAGSWERDWGLNIGTSALTVLGTVAIVERIVKHESSIQRRRRLRFLMGDGFINYGLSGTWQTHLMSIAGDYVYSHNNSYRQPPNGSIALLEFWLANQGAEDPPLPLKERFDRASQIIKQASPDSLRPSRAETLLASAENLANELAKYRATDAEVLGDDVILAIDRCRADIRTLRVLFNHDLATISNTVKDAGSKSLGASRRRVLAEDALQNERDTLRQTVLWTLQLGRVMVPLDRQRLGQLDHPPPPPLEDQDS
jgi:hypothetical protein